MSKTKDSVVLYKATALIEKLQQLTTENKLWYHLALLNISLNKEIVLEWCHLDRKLTIYVSAESIDYIKVSGADMNREMWDGSVDLEDADSLLSVWKWLLTTDNTTCRQF